MLRPTPEPLAWRVLEPLLDTPPAGVTPSQWDAAIVEPLRSFLQRPGKEFRGCLLTHAWRLIRPHDSPPDELLAAVELIHAASLILDDIEDDSGCRRGRPCLHREFGLPLALNAGTTLLLLPLQLIDRAALPAPVAAAVQRAATQAMVTCHRGQALDLSIRVGQCDQRDAAGLAHTISQLKTGSLMRLSTELGAIAANAAPVQVAALANLGDRLGVALQMLNDWADLTCGTDPDKRWEDLFSHRLTWPWGWAAERVPADRWRSLETDCLALGNRLDRAERLADELQVALGTDRPYEELLHDALADVKSTFGNHPVLAALRADLDRLVASYVG